MLLEPHTNVKMPMVRKPVHMIKPRVVTLQKSSHNSLEKKCFPLKTSSSYTNQKRDSNDSNSASYQRQLILGKSLTCSKNSQHTAVSWTFYQYAQDDLTSGQWPRCS